LERWDGVAQGRDLWSALVNTSITAETFFSFCTIGGSSRRAQLRGVNELLDLEKNVLGTRLQV
jgi:hypothetical protein